MTKLPFFLLCHLQKYELASCQACAGRHRTMALTPTELSCWVAECWAGAVRWQCVHRDLSCV